MMRTAPLFVLGKHRSGTTFLANTLAAHPGIAGVCHEMHDGIHESGFFSHAAPLFERMKGIPGYIWFTEAFCRSDYFRLTGLDGSVFYEKITDSPYEYFRVMMDRFAVGKKYWIEKTPNHTLHADNLARNYPDARFIAIRRGFKDVLLSGIVMTMRHDRKSGEREKSKAYYILRLCFACAVYDRALSRHVGDRRFLHIRYEDLVRDTANVLRRVCRFLGIRYSERLLKARYRKNTSFDGMDRNKLLGGVEMRCAVLLYHMLRAVPFAISGRVYRVFERRRLPWWFYGFIRKEYNLRGEDAV